MRVPSRGAPVRGFTGPAAPTLRPTCGKTPRRCDSAPSCSRSSGPATVAVAGPMSPSARANRANGPRCPAPGVAAWASSCIKTSRTRMGSSTMGEIWITGTPPAWNAPAQHSPSTSARASPTAPWRPLRAPRDGNDRAHRINGGNAAPAAAKAGRSSSMACSSHASRVIDRAARAAGASGGVMRRPHPARPQPGRRSDRTGTPVPRLALSADWVPHRWGRGGFAGCPALPGAGRCRAPRIPLSNPHSCRPSLRPSVRHSAPTSSIGENPRPVCHPALRNPCALPYAFFAPLSRVSPPPAILWSCVPLAPCRSSSPHSCVPPSPPSPPRGSARVAPPGAASLSQASHSSPPDTACPCMAPTGP